MAEHTKVDAVTGTATTGHEWDGIGELNTPLPRWWLWVFYATIVWSVGYWVVYPAWPLVRSYTTGVFGYSTRGQVETDLAELKKVRGDKAATLAAVPLADIAKDPALLALRARPGQGGVRRQLRGLPRQRRRRLEGLSQPQRRRLAVGRLARARSTRPSSSAPAPATRQTRESQMPAFGRDGMLKRDEIVDGRQHVRSLAGLPTRAGTDLAAGKKLFADNCAVCHGDAGKGNQELGAPNLTDAIWLYGSDEATIIDVIHNSRGSVMPAWVDRLDPVTVKSLAVYVHTLGGGK